MRENSAPIAASVLLHASLAAALLGYTLLSIKRTPSEVQPIPIDAQVIDSQVLRQAQQSLIDRAAQEAARARAAAEAQAAARAKAEEDAAEAAVAQRSAEAERAVKSAQAAQAAEAVQAAAQVKREADAKHLQDAHRAAEAQKLLEAKRLEDTKQAEEAKRAADLKQAEDAKRAAEQRAKAEREAELKRQLADEEHVNAVSSGPLRDQYMARLQARIQTAWLRPPSARVGLDCLVQVTQVPGGEVTGAHVTQCNGDAATRDSIENAVYRASPLPLPSDPALFSRTFAFHFHPDQ